ncbi:MAG: geranylgeranylglycerol-phosphate geranylgeranyltransferase [Thermoplasmatota archaeon]
MPPAATPCSISRCGERHLPGVYSMQDGHIMLGRKARAFLRMTRPELAVMAVVSVYIGAGGVISTDSLLAMPAVSLITAGSMVFNDYFDRDIDRLAHPDRPVPAGLVLPREALWFSVALFAVAVALSLLINPWCLALAVFAIAFLVLYETRFKQQGVMGNIVVALLSGLAFTYGGTAVGRPWDAALLSLMAFFVILGREILMDTRDMSADTIKRFTLPMRIGQRAAVRVGGMAAAVSIILTPFPVIWGILGRWYLALFIPAAALLAYGIFAALQDTGEAGYASDLFRIAMAMALGAFLLGIAL